MKKINDTEQDTWRKDDKSLKQNKTRKTRPKESKNRDVDDEQEREEEGTK
jgi:hypothetical protein